MNMILNLKKSTAISASLYTAANTPSTRKDATAYTTATAPASNTTTRNECILSLLSKFAEK